MTTRYLRHVRVSLALHTLRAQDAGPSLLHLHGLGERSPAAVPRHLEQWPGPVYALDFTGHGESSVPLGGGYTAEVLMSDVDAVVAALGPSTLYGRGLGGYVGLLLAGARPADVKGVVIDDGPGLYGGATAPTSPVVLRVDPSHAGPPDPWAMLELANDLRPPAYALSFVKQAIEHSGLAHPIAVAARTRPAWLDAVATAPGVLVGELGELLQALAVR